MEYEEIIESELMQMFDEKAAKVLNKYLGRIINDQTIHSIKTDCQFILNDILDTLFVPRHLKYEVIVTVNGIKISVQLKRIANL